MQYLDFIPAELNEIMGTYGYSWPKHLPMAASGGKYRTLEEICQWYDIDLAQLPFKEMLEVLCNGKFVAKATRMSRRKYLDNWHLYSNADRKGLCVAFSSSGGEISISWFQEEAQFWTWLLGDFSNFPMPEIPQTSIERMSEAEWGLQIGLCDFFLRTYPTPDIDWEPNQLLVFDVNSLREDMKNADGWAAAWYELGGLPVVSDTELEETIYTWCHEGRLAALDIPGGGTVFSLGKDWTWLTRTMAWWDRAVKLEIPGKAKLIFVQASALWIVANQGTIWEMSAMEGSQISGILSKYLGQTITIEKLANAASSTTEKQFCHQCGKPHEPGDLFCRHCGAKL